MIIITIIFLIFTCSNLSSSLLTFANTALISSLISEGLICSKIFSGSSFKCHPLLRLSFTSNILTPDLTKINSSCKPKSSVSIQSLSVNDDTTEDGLPFRVDGNVDAEDSIVFTEFAELADAAEGDLFLVLRPSVIDGNSPIGSVDSESSSTESLLFLTDRGWTLLFVNSLDFV